MICYGPRCKLGVVEVLESGTVILSLVGYVAASLVCPDGFPRSRDKWYTLLSVLIHWHQ